MRPPRLDILVEVQMHIKYDLYITPGYPPEKITIQWTSVYKTNYAIRWIAIYQAPVVQRLDNAIHWRNRYPVDKCYQNKPRYLLDSDLSGV